MEGCSEGKQTRLGSSARRERSQFASREVLYSVQYVNDGLRVEEVSQFIAVNLAQVKYHLCQFHRRPGVKYVRGHLADHKAVEIQGQGVCVCMCVKSRGGIGLLSLKWPPSTLDKVLF